MKAILIVLAVIAGLIVIIAAALIFGHASIRIVCKKRLRVVLTVLGIPVTLLSDEDPPEWKRCRNPDRILKKELKRAEQKNAQSLKKKKKSLLKKQKKRRAKSVGASPNLPENIAMVTALVKKAYRMTRGKISIRVRRLHIAVAAEEASTAAILYGSALQGIAYLCQWIETHFSHIQREDGDMRVYPDFTAQKPSVDIDIACKVSLRSALSIGLGMRKAIRQEKKRAINKAKIRVAKKQKRSHKTA